MTAKRSIVDLTKPVNESLEIYRSGAYSDPTPACEDWCTIEDQGYWVSRLSLGTQTGTHIDAPAHFLYGGATLEQLPVSNLVGSYYLLELDSTVNEQMLRTSSDAYKGEPILFLRVKEDSHSLTRSELELLLDLESRVWVLAGCIKVKGEADLAFHRILAEYGVYLVEDLDPDASSQVCPGGELIALPLRLEGVSGSPCRVLVRH